MCRYEMTSRSKEKEADCNTENRNPEVTVVIITYNRAEMLRRALESVVCQETDGEFSYEIIIVDNASTDATKVVMEEVAKNCLVPVRYILEEDKGVAQARNRALKESESPWIAFFDDDQWAESNWLKNLIATALKMGAECVGGTRRLDLPQVQLSGVGPVCRTILGENIWHKEPARCLGKNIPSSGNILIARRVFDSIGLFDTSMFFGGSDAEFVTRARAADCDIWVAPKAIVHHVIPSYRLERSYLIWVSLRWGCNFAYADCKRFGRGKMLLFCIARIGQALFVNIPFLLFAYLKCEKAEILDRKCLLWRCMAYARKTLFLIAPRVFTQERFFARLEFRRERKVYAKTIPLTEREGIRK